MLFNVSERREGDQTVLSVLGDVDLATLPELAGRIARTHGDLLVVDLSDVDYFDPLCLGVLIAGHLRCVRADRRFAIRCVGRTRDLIHESGLDQIMTVLDGADGTDGAEREAENPTPETDV
ncbi:MAG: STAS domain-containing protein [Microthrixaceae bacterium]|nr:STAS domain-containing protein [Microthrixaceae bacterium]